MTFGVNTSPLAGREGKFVTSRQIKARLDKEVLGNVSIEVRPSDSSEAFEVRGRGELQLAVLIEQMRREGYELTASRPEVLLREVGGEVQEPYERITIDIPPDYIGDVQTAIAGRKGRLEQISTDTDGRVRMEFVLPVRGLIGYRGQLLTDTRGTALLHQIGEGYGPWAGDVTHRTNGVLVSDRAGTSNAYGLFNLEQRAELFIGAGVEVYEGMIVGENSRSGDMDVNPTKEKKLTNIRTHSHDESLRLTPARPITLESALEFIAADELVEVTPTRSGCASAPSPSTTAGARRVRRTTCGAPRSARRPQQADRESALLAVARPARLLFVARPCGARPSPTSDTGARHGRSWSRWRRRAVPAGRRPRPTAFQADVVDHRDGVGHPATTQQDPRRGPGPDARECLELGERLGLGQQQQPFGVEDAIDGQPARVVQPPRLDLRRARSPNGDLEQALRPREWPDRPAIDLDRVAVRLCEAVLDDPRLTHRDALADDERGGRLVRGVEADRAEPVVPAPARRRAPDRARRPQPTREPS